MRHITHKRADTGDQLHIFRPTRSVEDDPDMTDEQIEQRGWDAIKSYAINPQWIEKEAIPKDRIYREAWEHEGKDIVTNMPRAQEIHKDRLRAMRKPLMESLDVQFMQALESGADTKAIVAKKQSLRDVTADTAIAKAQTPEELKAVMPEILKEKM